MGKGILIFVMASTISLATLYLARTEQDLATAQTEADYQGKILAQQTAQSAFNIVISKARQLTGTVTYTSLNNTYGGATYDIGADKHDDGITLIAVGRYGRHSFEIIGSMTMQGQGINETMNVDGSGTEFEFKKDAVISGIDASGQTEASAVLVSDPETLEDLGGEENHIEGSMVLGESSTLMSAIESAILTYPDKLEYSALGPNDTKQNIGSPSSPEIVVVNGDVTLDNGFEGYGILYVDGNLTINNGAMWYGIVFVTGDDSGLELKQDSYIEGTLFLDGIEEVDMKTDTRIQYNSAALEMLGYFLEAIDTEGQNEVIRQVANTSYKDGQEMGNAYIDDSVTEARNLLN